MLLPVIFESSVDAAATQGDNGISAPDSPEHAGSLEARSDDALAASFHHAGANEESLAAELWIAHPVGIGCEVFSLCQNLLSQVGMSGDMCSSDLAEASHQRFNAAVIQQVFHGSHPEFFRRRIMGV